MCERKSGTISLRWRRNATSRMKSLGMGMGKIRPSLLARGVLPLLCLPLGILRHYHLCHSSTLIANVRRLNFFLVLQWPVCSPSQIPFTSIPPQPPLFIVLSHVRYWGLHCYPPSHPRTEEAVKKEKSSAPRGDDGVDRHGQPVFVPGGEGPKKIGRSVTPMLDVSSADECQQHHRVLEPIPPLPTWPSVWWCLRDLRRRPYLLHLRKAARHC